MSHDPDGRSPGDNFPKFPTPFQYFVRLAFEVQEKEMAGVREGVEVIAREFVKVCAAIEAEALTRDRFNSAMEKLFERQVLELATLREEVVTLRQAMKAAGVPKGEP